MHLALICRILGVLLMIFSLTMLTPLIVAAIYNENTHTVFLASFAVTLISGALLWLPVHNRQAELRTRDGFLITSLFWLVLGLFGAMPFMFSAQTQLSISDAAFESISGLTTTGATVIAGLDNLPKSLLFYRSQLCFLGGIGIIVIAVAILPILGVGGMQLYRAETPGPVKDSKLTPRITETAKALFFIYVMLNVLCTLAYWLAGMTLFDAICHSFSTIATAGYSTHDASFGYFNSSLFILIASFFMFISGLNFALHFYAWRLKSLSHYLRDSEAIFYGSLTLACIGVVAVYLAATNTYDVPNSLLHSIFQVVSMTTTTGFATVDFSSWPSFLPILIIMMSFMGGCASSTSGGIKAVRVMLMAKQGLRELKQLVHPNAIIPLKVGSRRVEAKIVSAVWSFFAVYMTSFVVLLFGVMATGVSFTTAFSAVVACINNMGPGLEQVAANFSSLTATAKWLLCFAMLLGRLEVFTLLVLFTPAFWRR